MAKYISNGKLLLTGEYLVLDGTTALAVPTKFGQNLMTTPIANSQLIWESFTYNNICWFQAVFELPKLRLVSCSFTSDKEENSEYIAETLQTILLEAKKLNSNFLQTKKGISVQTTLSFPRNWGLGSSSTLINNIASWANVNAYQLLWNAFSGSGYDIACAQNNTPIFYQLRNQQPIVQQAQLNQNLLEQLYFVHLNKKQNSRDGIFQYKKNRKKNIKSAIDEVSFLSKEFVKANTLTNLEKIMTTHEKLISSIIQQTPIKKQLFADYFGEIKSLGAWGGDFILATGNQDTPNYFYNKGFKTVFSYKEMVY